MEESIRTPIKSPCPQRFLTKDSNTVNFTAWDVDGRVGDMESQFKELKDMVNSTLTERKGHEDALEIQKTRGKLTYEGMCPESSADA